MASTKTIHSRSWMSRLLVSLTIGLMMLALGATTAFAASGVQTTHFAAPVISTGGTQASFDEDCDDEDDDDCEEGSSGGGLPATDTVAVTGTAVSAGAQVALNEDDEDDEDEDEEGGSGGGGLPSTDTASLASSSDAGTPLPAVALLVIAGLAGGAIKVASKRSI